MHNKSTLGFILSIILILSVASCVQPASEQTAPTPLGVGANSTWTAVPTNTNTPTTTATPTATELSGIDAQAVSDTETPTATPSPTDAQSALIQLDATATVDPLTGQITAPQLTATAIIADATATQAFILTSTAAGFGVGGATETPTPTATVDGAFGVATTDPTTALIPGNDCFHEVRAEDQSLYRLSLAYGVPVLDIARASGIVNPDLIRVGQMLTIPGCGTTGGRPPATSTPRPNVGTGGINTDGNTTTGVIATNPTGDCTWGTSVIFPGGCPSATGFGTGTDTGAAAGTGGPGNTFVGSRTHTVGQGETLYEISLQYGVTMDAIASANGIANYDQIRFNQVLVIP